MADERQQLESRLSTLRVILRHLEELHEQRRAIYARHSHLYRPLAQPWGKGPWWLLYFAVGTLTFIVWSVVGRAILQLADHNDDMGPFIVFALGMFVVPTIVAIVGASVIRSRYNKQGLPKKNAAIRDLNEQTRDRIEQMVGPEIATIDAEIQSASDSYSAYGYVGFFPERYLNSADVTRCWEFVRDHRAFSVQQAINLLEEELHRTRMENFQAAQLAEQERARRTAQVGNLINAFGHLQTHRNLRDIHDRL